MEYLSKFMWRVVEYEYDLGFVERIDTCPHDRVVLYGGDSLTFHVLMSFVIKPKQFKRTSTSELNECRMENIEELLYLIRYITNPLQKRLSRDCSKDDLQVDLSLWMGGPNELVVMTNVRYNSLESLQYCYDLKQIVDSFDRFMTKEINEKHPFRKVQLTIETTHNTSGRLHSLYQSRPSGVKFVLLYNENRKGGKLWEVFRDLKINHKLSLNNQIIQHRDNVQESLFTHRGETRWDLYRNPLISILPILSNIQPTSHFDDLNVKTAIYGTDYNASFQKLYQKRMKNTTQVTERLLLHVKICNDFMAFCENRENTIVVRARKKVGQVTKIEIQQKNIMELNSYFKSFRTPVEYLSLKKKKTNASKGASKVRRTESQISPSQMDVQSEEQEEENEAVEPSRYDPNLNVETRMINVYDDWLKSPQRRNVTITFNPDPKCQTAYDEVNMWKGYDIDGETEDKWYQLQHSSEKKDMLLFIIEHLFKILCNENAEDFWYIMNWLSKSYNEPYKKLEGSLLVVGNQGVGKSLFFTRFLKQVFSPYGKEIANLDKMINQGFNSLLDDPPCVYLILDDTSKGVWSGDTVMYEKFKNMLTSETLEIRKMHRNYYTIPNYLKVVSLMNPELEIRTDGAAKEARRTRIFKCKEWTPKKIGEAEHRRYCDYLVKSVNDEVCVSAFTYILKEKKLFSIHDLNEKFGDSGSYVPMTTKCALKNNYSNQLPLVQRWMAKCVKQGYIIPPEMNVFSYANGFITNQMKKKLYEIDKDIHIQFDDYDGLFFKNEPGNYKIPKIPTSVAAVMIDYNKSKKIRGVDETFFQKYCSGDYYQHIRRQNFVVKRSQPSYEAEWFPVVMKDDLIRSYDDFVKEEHNEIKKRPNGSTLIRNMASVITADEHYFQQKEAYLSPSQVFSRNHRININMGNKEFCRKFENELKLDCEQSVNSKSIRKTKRGTIVVIPTRQHFKEMLESKTDLTIDNIVYGSVINQQNSDEYDENLFIDFKKSLESLIKINSF